MEILQLARKTRPNKHVQRDLWNSTWERDLEEAYSKVAKVLPRLAFTDNNPSTPQHHVEIARKVLEPYKTDIISLQIESRRKSITRLATDDYAEKWNTLPVNKRRKHVLEALYKVASAGVDFEEHRRWCPELMVGRLSEDPRVFLDLLMVLVQGQDGEITHFPHPFVDEYMKRLSVSINSNNPMFATKMKMDRTFFMTMFVWRVYLSFHDLDEIYRFDSSTGKEIETQFQGMVNADIKQKKQWARVKKALKASDAGEVRRCWGCGQSEAALPPGTILQVCAGCKKIDRKVLYCSRECQKDDWKSSKGQLLRHKDFCGKPLPEVDPHYMDIDEPEYIIQSVESIREILQDIPPGAETSSTDGDVSHSSPFVLVEPASASGGDASEVELQDSPSLLYQKRLLKADHPPDYNLVMKHPHPDYGIRIPGVQLRIEFRKARDLAMKNGDAAAVRRMHQILEPFAKRLAPPAYNLKNQLKKEYRVDLQ